MTTPNPGDIVGAALSKGELAQLLLGAPEYRYRSKYSPAPGDTNLVELLEVIYDDPDPRSRDLARSALGAALDSLNGTYEGIDPISTCILLESSRRSDGRPTLGLPIGDLAGALRATIRTFEARLGADRSGGGAHWPDGRLGDLRRLSRNTADRGGPAFCP